MTFKSPYIAPSSTLRPPSNDQYKRVLKQQGYLYFSNLNDDFDWIQYLVKDLKLGQLVLQEGEEYIAHIKSDQRYQSLSYSKSTNPARPHTEAPYLQVPPKYLALWCEQPAVCGGGHTILADGYDFLLTLTEAEQAKLASNIYPFKAKVGKHRSSHNLKAKILTFRPTDGLMLRWSYNVLKYGDHAPRVNSNEAQTIWQSDPFLRKMSERILSFYDESAIPILMDKGSLLVWDNHRMIHGRTGYSDPSRHLKRVWLH